MNRRDLYGGNMSMNVPTHAVDVSDVRDVPDNQEVFVHAATDQSLIVELLSRVEEPDEQALRTHYHDIANSNDVHQEDNTIVTIETLPTNQLSLSQCSSAYYLIGRQLVAKFNETARNLVEVHLALLRIPGHGTDVVVTLNDPQSISAQSSSAPTVASAAGAGEAVNAAAKWTVEDFRASVTSLTLLNPEFLGD